VPRLALQAGSLCRLFDWALIYYVGASGGVCVFPVDSIALCTYARTSQAKRKAVPIHHHDASPSWLLLRLNRTLW
jgi:uncharacterized membrane protein